jgi:chemotaxis protein histidine kinase CheA
LAKDLGKAAPEVKIEAPGIFLTEQGSRLLHHVFIHLLRNAVDHGIEAPEERRKKGKPERGFLRLEAHDEGQWLVIKLSDDGRGLNMQRIAEKGLAQGLCQEGVSSAELADLIFENDFSTASTVTDISGRGVGMAAVRQYLDGEGGGRTSAVASGNAG